jgi:hypothetical protein
MLWGDRPDGQRLYNLPAMRVLMPLLMPTRNGAAVFHEQQVDLTVALPWLAEQKQADNSPLTLFHLYLHALAQTLHDWPELQRFVAGGRLYQRTHLELSFAVKKQKTVSAGLTAVKVRLQPGAGLLTHAAQVDAVIAAGRDVALTVAEREMALVRWLPTPMLAALIGLQRWLDNANLLPAALTANDPLYCSAFVANLGSIGLNAPYHHLYDWGTAPLFGVLGRVQPIAFAQTDGTVQARTGCVIRWTYDERIADGLYCAKALVRLQELLERPDLHVAK